MNLHQFLNSYSICPVCERSIFIEMILTFDCEGKKFFPFRLHINYIKDIVNKNHHRYIKYKDDDDRAYNNLFDRAPNDFLVSNDGYMIFSNNEFATNSYYVYAYCQEEQNHFSVETKEVYTNSNVAENKSIRVWREEVKIKQYRLVNDYDIRKTKIYIDDSFKVKCSIKLIPFAELSSKPNDLISKIESLLMLI